MSTQLYRLLVPMALHSAENSVLFVSQSRRPSDTLVHILPAQIHQSTHFVSDFQIDFRHFVSGVRIIQSGSQQKRERICKWGGSDEATFETSSQHEQFSTIPFFFSFSSNGSCTGLCLHFSHRVKRSRTCCCHGFHSIMKWKCLSCCGCCHRPPKAAQCCIEISFIRCSTNVKRLIWFSLFSPPQTPDLTLAILTLFRLQEIDEYINQAKEKGYTAVIELGTKGVNYATNVIMQTALKVSQVSTRCARLICLFLAHTNHNQVMKAISRSPSVNHSIKLGKRDKENILFAWHFLHPSFFCMNHSGF